MKKIILSIISILILVLFQNTKVFATDYYWSPSSGNTSWSTASNWKTGSCNGSTASTNPGPNDNVYIGYCGSGNITVVIDINDTVQSIYLSSNRQLLLNTTSPIKYLYLQGSLYTNNTSTTSGGTARLVLIGTGSQTVSGGSESAKGMFPHITINKPSGTAYFENIISICGSASLKLESGTIDEGSSTVYFHSANTLSGNLRFNHITFNASNTYYTLSSAISVYGTLSFTGSSTIDLRDSAILLYGNFINNTTTTAGCRGGRATVKLVGTANQTIQNTVNSANNAWWMPNLAINKSSGTLYLKGKVNTAMYWTNNYSTTNINSDSAVVNFILSTQVPTGTPPVIGGTNTTILKKARFTCANEWIFTLNNNGSNAAVKVTDSLWISGSSGVRIDNGTLECTGHIVVDNTATGIEGSGTATLLINGTGNQNYYCASSRRTGIPNIVINKSSGSFIINGYLTCKQFTYQNGTIDFTTHASTLESKGNITSSNGTTNIYLHHLFIFNATVINNALLVNGNLTIQSGAYFYTSNGNNYAVSIGGNLIVDGTFSGYNSHITFNGSSTQTISGSTTGLSFYKFIINKPASSISLNRNLTVSNNLSLTKGVLSVASTFAVTLNNSVTVTGGSDSSYVTGVIKKIGNQAFTFPTGGSGYYHPIYISAPSTTTDAFTAEYVSAAYNTSQLDTSLTYAAKCSFWNIERTAGTATVKVRLHWNNASCDIYTLSTLRIGLYDNSISKWKSVGSTTISGSTSLGYIETTLNQSSFGKYSIAKKSPTVYALAGADKVFCFGGSDTLGALPAASGGLAPYNYSWSPASSLSSSTIARPLASPSVTTTYVLTVTDLDLSTSTDTVVVTVHQLPVVNAGEDKILCSGNSAKLGSFTSGTGGTGVLSYQWFPSSGLSSSTVENPLANPLTSTSYILKVIDSIGCFAYDTIIVTRLLPITVSLGNDTTVSAHAPVLLSNNLLISGGANDYIVEWQPSSYIDYPSEYYAILKTPRTSEIIVTITDTIGCFGSDTVIVHISNEEPLFYPEFGGGYFLKNMGQYIDSSGAILETVKYKSDLPGESILLLDSALIFYSTIMDTSGTRIDSLYLWNIKYDGISNNVNIVAGDTLGAMYSYYLSYLPEYVTGVKNVRFVKYENMFEGINSNIFNNNGSVSWVMQVSEIAAYEDIALQFNGVDTIYIDSLGYVNFATPIQWYFFSKPVGYQYINGRIDTLACNYTLTGNTLGISIPNYDTAYAIDIIINPPTAARTPVILDGIYMQWSTYFGGAGVEAFNAVDVSETYEQAHIFAVGFSSSQQLPILGIPPGFQEFISNNRDAIAARFNIANRSLTRFTYSGGSLDDEAYDCKKGPGSSYIFCGYTQSSDYPLQFTGFVNNYFITAPQTNLNNNDGIITVLDVNFSLRWSTYLKGISTNKCIIDNINFNAPARLLVVGSAAANIGINNEFDPNPVPGWFNNTINNGAFDATLMQFRIPGTVNANYGRLEWSFYFGGNNNEKISSVALSDIGVIVLLGKTNSTNFPIINNSVHPTYQNTLGGGNDNFLIYLNPDRNIYYTSYFGGNGNETWSPNQIPFDGDVIFVEPDSRNFVFETPTLSTNLPISTGGAAYAGNQDFYIARFGENQSIIYSTYFGGDSWEGIASLTPSIFDNSFYMAGSVLSGNFPVQDLTMNSFFDDQIGGNNDAFISKFLIDASGTNITNQWTTFMGGVIHENIRDVTTRDINGVEIIFDVGVTGSNIGTEINQNTGQPPQNAFPLCNFSSGVVDFYQPFYSVPQVNLINGIIIPSGFNEDAFIQSYVNNCGASCFRLAEADEDVISIDSASVQQSIQIFPNPTEHQFNYRITKNTGDQIIIFNIIGAQLFSYTPTSTSGSILLSQYPSGIYILKYGPSTVKIIKQ